MISRDRDIMAGQRPRRGVSPSKLRPVRARHFPANAEDESIPSPDVLTTAERGSGWEACCPFRMTMNLSWVAHRRRNVFASENYRRTTLADCTVIVGSSGVATKPRTREELSEAGSGPLMDRARWEYANVRGAE